MSASLAENMENLCRGSGWIYRGYHMAGQYKTRTADCGLGIKYGLAIGIKCGLRTEYKTRARYKTRTTD